MIVARQSSATTLPRPASDSGVSVVGIPTRNEASTISTVMQTADAGLIAAFPRGSNIIALADNGSTDGTVERFLDTASTSAKAVVRSPGAHTGKGTNVLALVAKARELGADRLILLDGDLRSAQPGWVRRLAAAVDNPAPTMAVPVYRRNRYEANSTNHLVRPLLAAALGSSLSQPIGGDFAFNRAFLDQLPAWPQPASAQLYGIDVWLTGNALCHGHRVVEAPLGRKLHNSPFPKILHLPQQVLDSLFHVVARLGRARPMPADTPAPTPGIDRRARRQDPAVIAHVTSAVACYLDTHRDDLLDLLPTARTLDSAPWGLRVTFDTWPHLMAEALAGLSGGEFERSRDHLIALFINRVMTFWDEIDGLDDHAIGDLLHAQSRDTAAAVAERDLVFQPLPESTTFQPGRWRPFQ